MSKRLKACLIALVIAAAPLSATAENNDTVTGDKATDMVVVRPLGLAATVIGTVLTVVPFSTFWGPMAAAIMGGLFVATMLTLLFVPALYAVWFKVQRVV